MPLAADFKVLSYNVRVFNSYNHLKDDNYASSYRMINYLNESKAHILCLQEFYNNNQSDIFNSVDAISGSFDYSYFQPVLTVKDSSQFGLCIFSKFPIIDKGYIELGSLNQIVYADIALNFDTIRVYNVHLESMSMEDDDLVSVSATGKFHLFDIFMKGSLKRTQQLKRLTDHAQCSPYPVIVCGDFNDIPLSYNYCFLGKFFKNAFENSGLGIGATYNGKIPFLRLDNQFYNGKLKNNYALVHDTIKFSDHFPLEAGYSFGD